MVYTCFTCLEHSWELEFLAKLWYQVSPFKKGTHARHEGLFTCLGELGHLIYMYLLSLESFASTVYKCFTCLENVWELEFLAKLWYQVSPLKKGPHARHEGLTCILRVWELSLIHI